MIVYTGKPVTHTSERIFDMIDIALCWVYLYFMLGGIEKVLVTA